MNCSLHIKVLGEIEAYFSQLLVLSVTLKQPTAQRGSYSTNTSAVAIARGP